MKMLNLGIQPWFLPEIALFGLAWWWGKIWLFEFFFGVTLGIDDAERTTVLAFEAIWVYCLLPVLVFPSWALILYAHPLVFVLAAGYMFCMCTEVMGEVWWAGSKGSPGLNMRVIHRWCIRCQTWFSLSVVIALVASVPMGFSRMWCAGSAGTGERALRVSVDAALRAGIFKASGSFDPMGFWDERER